MATIISNRSEMWRDEVNCVARREPMRRWRDVHECVLVASQLADPRTRNRAR